MPAISSFRRIENKHDVYSNKDGMEKFCESLREHTMKISNYKRKLLIKHQQESHKNVRNYYIF